jgi:hypothetical protein
MKVLDGKVAIEPKRLRYRLLHVAARLAFHATRREAAPAGQLALGQRPRRRLSESSSAGAPISFQGAAGPTWPPRARASAI